MIIIVLNGRKEQIRIKKATIKLESCNTVEEILPLNQ